MISMVLTCFSRLVLISLWSSGCCLLVRFYSLLIVFFRTEILKKDQGPLLRGFLPQIMIGSGQLGLKIHLLRGWWHYRYVGCHSTTMPYLVFEILTLLFTKARRIQPSPEVASNFIFKGRVVIQLFIGVFTCILLVFT